MYVNKMTTQNLVDDLTAIKLTWPDGVPPAQADRVNALTRELKRRADAGETIPDGSARRPGAMPAAALMSTEQLEKELRDMSARLGADPKDEVAQKRFADVRFELRARAKGAGEAAPDRNVEASSPLPAREIDFPEATTPTSDQGGGAYDRRAPLELDRDKFLGKAGASYAKSIAADRFVEAAGLKTQRRTLTEDESRNLMRDRDKFSVTPSGDEDHPIKVVVSKFRNVEITFKLSATDAFNLGNLLRDHALQRTLTEEP